MGERSTAKCIRYMKQLNMLTHIDKINPPKKKKPSKYILKNIVLKKVLYLQT